MDGSPARRLLPLLALVAVAVAIASFFARPAPERGGVVVTIPPLAGLVGPLMPEGQTPTVIVPAGRSVHGYEATPADRAAIERAALVVCVGLGIEGPLETMLARTERADRLVRFADAVGIVSDGHDHAHDHAHGHSHGGVDAHLWLDPGLAGGLVRAGAAKLGEDDPSRSARRDALLAEIARVDEAYADRLAPFSGARVITHHNAWSRLLERHGIEIAEVMRPFEVAEPSPSQIATATTAMREQEIRAVLVEPQYDASTPRRLAEAAGVPVGVLDPLGSGDWIAMMESNLDELVRVLELSAPEAPSEPGPDSP